MSAIKAFRQWLQTRLRPAEARPDPVDTGITEPPRLPRSDFNQGLFPMPPEQRLHTSEQETRAQRLCRDRSGPWQQK